MVCGVNACAVYICNQCSVPAIRGSNASFACDENAPILILPNNTCLPQVLKVSRSGDKMFKSINDCSIILETNITGKDSWCVQDWM